MKDVKFSNIKRRSIRILSELHSSKAPTLITENDPLSPNLPDDDLDQRRIHILEGITPRARPILMRAVVLWIEKLGISLRFGLIESEIYGVCRTQSF